MNAVSGHVTCTDLAFNKYPALIADAPKGLRLNSKKTALTVVWMVLTLMLLSLWGGNKTFAAPRKVTQELLKEADDCRDDLYRSAAKKKYRHHWSRCINLYQNISTRYPKSEEAVWAMYKAARMYTNLYRHSGRPKDLDEAVDIFREVVETYRSHRLADDAQYRIGEVFYKYKEDPTQAYVEFLKVDIMFPEGDMRPKARSMLDKLAVILSEKQADHEKNQTVPTGDSLVLVKDIRHWSTPTYTRVVIDLERPVKYGSNMLYEDPKRQIPGRLYVDLEGTHVGSDIESPIPIKDGLLQRARAGQYTKDRVRVVLDIDNISGYKVFPLHDPFRIVVDVRGVEKKTENKKTAPVKSSRPVRKGTRRVKKPSSTVSLARQLGLNVRRIVIDPGHGGKDPGTYFKGGIEEKDIVLNLAKAMVPKLEKALGCEVILTRTKDVFIPLEKRTAFANVNKADLFISLHVNSHHLARVHGIETYFLNMATDKRAVMLAAAENATSEKNISDLQKILNELMLNTKINESSKLAYEVQKGIIGRVKRTHKKVKDLGVKQAPFYVLIGAEMPAILVETGFITNPTERRLLLTSKYIDYLADGIVRGIDDYVKSIDQTYKGG